MSHVVTALKQFLEGGLLAEIVECNPVRIIFIAVVNELIHSQALRRLSDHGVRSSQILFPGHIVDRRVHKSCLIVFFPGAVN